MKIIFLYFVLFIITPHAFAQNNFIAIPKEIEAKYHINFEKLFFKSPAEERQNYLSLKNMLNVLEQYKGKVASSSENLLNALKLYDTISVQNSFHDAYLYLRYAVNTNETISSDYDTEINSEVYNRTQFLLQELMQIPGNNLTRFISENPELKAYLFEIETSRRMNEHSLPLKEEERLGKISPSATDWQYELYQSLLKQINYTRIKTKDGTELNVGTQRSEIMNNSERNIREAGFKNRFSDIAKQRDLFAFDLIKLIKGKNSLSMIHNFKNYPEESYFNKYLDVTGVNGLLSEVEKNTAVIKKFEQVRADHIKKITGYDEINYWDISAGLKDNSVPRFNIDSASKIILKTVLPLGKEYEMEMAELLDPSNGRLDIVPGENRLPGGGGVGFPGIPNVFYSQGFEGYYKDLSILIHESGHVVHFQLMGNNNVKPAYGSGPNYFSESFAIFNELILADYLYQNEKDTLKKIFYLEQFLDVKGLEIFRGAQDAQLEQSIYSGVEENKIQNADDLDKLTLNVLSKYTIWADKHPDQFKDFWIVNRLMYEDPLYYVNYMYGGLLSIEYYQMFKKDPKDFVDKYIALMRNGFNDTPSALLKKFFNINLNDPHILTDALNLLKEKIDELQGLY